MKGSSDVQPGQFVNTLGLFQFRYNITEVTKQDMNGTERVEFQYDYVNVPDKERGTIINAIISERYSKDAEIALINNEIATPGTPEYAEYQAFRDSVKTLI